MVGWPAGQEWPWATVWQVSPYDEARGDLTLRRPHMSQPVEGASSTKLLKCLSVPAVPGGPGISENCHERERAQSARGVLKAAFFSHLSLESWDSGDSWE